MMVFDRNLLFQGFIFRFHVSFRGCNPIILPNWSEHLFIIVYPKGSMGLVYLPTWMADFYGKCRQIYHTWILWVCPSLIQQTNVFVSPFCISVFYRFRLGRHGIKLSLLKCHTHQEVVESLGSTTKTNSNFWRRKKTQRNKWAAEKQNPTPKRIVFRFNDTILRRSLDP